MQLFHSSHRLSASFDDSHVRQLDAVATRWLANLSAVAPVTARIDDYALVDIDDTIKEVHGYQKQGSGYGYSSVRGLNALLGILSTTTTAPVIIGSRLRKGAAEVQRVRARDRSMGRLAPLNEPAYSPAVH